MQISTQISAQISVQIYDQIWRQIFDQILKHICDQIPTLHGRYLFLVKNACVVGGSFLARAIVGNLLDLTFFLWCQIWSEICCKICLQIYFQICLQICFQICCQILEFRCRSAGRC